MVIVTLRFKVSSEQRKNFLDSARLVSEPTQIQPGCISCRFYQDLNDPDAVLLVEEWESREKLDRHLNSDQYRIILSLMEFSSEKPEFKINTISKTEGLSAIQTVRGFS
ncbi:MAG: putative quinol monooxygenase [Planctomycetota bacterium]|jgi:quinol monooxygenase YgiN